MRIIHDMIEALVARGRGETQSLPSTYLKLWADGPSRGFAWSQSSRIDGVETELVLAKAAAPSKKSFVLTCLETCVLGSNFTLSAVVTGNYALLRYVKRLVAMNMTNDGVAIVEYRKQHEGQV